MSRGLSQQTTTNVLFACDSFKGTLPSYRVGQAAELGIRQAIQQVAAAVQKDKKEESIPSRTAAADSLLNNLNGVFRFYHCPMSDGGAGLLDSLTYKRGRPQQQASRGLQPAAVEGDGFERVFVPSNVPITGPLGAPLAEPVSFACDVKKSVLVVEMAEASGLPRVATASQRNPLLTTSYGTGELLRYALRYLEGELHRRRSAACEGGVDDNDNNDAAVACEVLLGIGGSATNDGGIGALQGLGVLDVYLADEAGEGKERKLMRPFCGRDLRRLSRVAVTPEMHRLFTPPSAKEDAEASGGKHCDNSCCRVRVFVRRVRLICDVDNPLVGPRGATYTFGPQKCAPTSSRLTTTPATPGPHRGTCGGCEAIREDGGDDGAVGVVTSVQQQAILDELEAGMQHAAERVVASTVADLVSLHGARSGSLRMEVGPLGEKVALDRLLHGSGGGGAGGMSGFFRHVLDATCMAGTDAVAELLSLRIPVSWSSSSHGGAAGIDGGERREDSGLQQKAEARGLLYTNCDVLVSAEGSFDTQTISSHKTVGRLLEMTVEANLSSFVASSSSRERGGDEKRIKEFIVVCGRMGFATDEECQARVHEALVQTLLPKHTPQEGTRAPPHIGYVNSYFDSLLHAYVSGRNPANTAMSSAEVNALSYKDAIALATPKVTVLPLSPSPFTSKEAMSQPYACVQARFAWYCLTGHVSGERGAMANSRITRSGTFSSSM